MASSPLLVALLAALCYRATLGMIFLSSVATYNAAEMRTFATELAAAIGIVGTAAFVVLKAWDSYREEKARRHAAAARDEQREQAKLDRELADLRHADNLENLEKIRTSLHQVTDKMQLGETAKAVALANATESNKVLVGKLGDRVDDLWDFQMRRADAASASKRLIESGGLTIPDHVRKLYDPIVAALRVYYAKEGACLSRRDLSRDIEKRWGEWIAKNVCVPLDIHDGECILVAMVLAAEVPATSIVREKTGGA